MPDMCKSAGPSSEPPDKKEEQVTTPLDTWSTSTGLLDDFEFEVTKAWFARSAEYQNGEILILHLEGKTDSPDTPTTTETYPCGRGWESLDGGKTARHESGAPRQFNKATAIGRLIDRCVKDLGMAEVLAGRGQATEAKVWEGLKFHIKREEETFTIKGETRTTNRPLPQAFLGVAGGETTTKDAASGSGGDDKAAKIAAAKAKAAAKNGGGSALEDQLKALAREHPTHEAFVDAAMDLPGVTDDDDLLQRVIDEAGLYAEARS